MATAFIRCFSNFRIDPDTLPDDLFYKYWEELKFVLVTTGQITIGG